MNQNPARDLMIALSLLPFLTPNRTRLLLEHFDPLETVSDAPSGVLERLLRVNRLQAEQVKNPLTRDTAALVRALRSNVVMLADPEYPPLLREIFDPPLALHVRGDASLLSLPSIAVVGSRRASPYAVNAAQHLARQLVPAGLAIVSGLALGVDAASHEAALDCGGKTIAVLGTGIDIVYPPANKRLFRRIAEKGVIATEFAPGTPPRRENFPIRNRIISGLSQGTIIVEATRRSGSLITARMAAEQNREVFAVPGSIFSDATEGTHRLVQTGAKLVHDVTDVLDELRGEFTLPQNVEHDPEPDSPLRAVLAALSRDDALHVDSIANRLGRTSSAVAEALLELELSGWIRALPGARYVRTR